MTKDSQLEVVGFRSTWAWLLSLSLNYLYYLSLVIFILLLFLIMILSDFSPRVLYSVFGCFKMPPLCESYRVRTGMPVSSSHAPGVWDSG